MPLYSDARSLQRICGQRLKGFEKQKKEAINERSEKKKMHAVKSMEKRFQREDENMTHKPYFINSPKRFNKRIIVST